MHEEDIQNLFGNKQQATYTSYSGGYYTSYQSWYGANAYLLMYRQIGFEQSDEIPDEMVPIHVRGVLEEERIQIEKEEDERRERMS